MNIIQETKLIAKALDFDNWYEDTIQLVVAKQSKPFASYRKNRWVKKSGVWKQMYNEGATAIEAVNLWALNHRK